MADYWKSNPRHFCKFCKCWIADNKPSRDFHEKGKRHQENVQKKIMEVRKKSIKEAKKEEEENSYMKEMEENARKAFLQDLKSDPKLAQQYLEKAKKKKETVERKEVPKLKEPESQAEQQPESSTKVISDNEGTWRITYSPEGYPYYWNDITGAVSWTEPEDGHIEYDTEQSAGEEDRTQSKDDVKSTTAKSQTKLTKPGNASLSSSDSDSNESDENEDSNSCIKTDNKTYEKGKKDEKKEENEKEEKDAETKETNQPSLPAFDPSDISSIPLPGEIPSIPVPLPPQEDEMLPEPPGPSESESQDISVNESENKKGLAQKRGHDSAYGSWEQVVHEEPEEVDLQLPETDQHIEQKVIQITEPKVKFREKKINSLGADLVAFKKRKMNNRNLKQRDT